MPAVARMPLIICLALSACTSSEPDRGETVARIDGDTITLEQVDARVQEAEPEAWVSLYEARQRALGYLIDERLLAQEASRQGIERDSLVQREVVETLAAVSDSAIAAFYEANRQRMDSQPLEEVRDQIQRYLAGAEHRAAWLGYVAGLRDAADLKVTLEPPRARIEVSEDEPSKGPVDAPILLVEYSDYECPYCGRAQPAVQQVLRTYGDRVRLVFRDFPLKMHRNASAAAQAGLCAQEQGRFWEYHDTLFAHQRQLRPDDLRRYAANLQLDTAAFDACLESDRYATAIDADLASGEQHGVSGTPAFFINGRRLSGAQPFAAFQQLIDDELERLAQTTSGSPAGG